MNPARPTPVTVIAILHFVFGGLTLFCSLGTLVMQTAINPALMGGMGNPQPGAVPGFDPNELVKQIEARTPAYMHTVGIAQEVVSIGLSVVMIVAGIGLLRLQPWGRLLTIGYGVVSIVLKIAMVVYTVVLVLPVMREINEVTMDQMQRMAKNPQEQAMMKMMISWINAAQIMGAVLPIVTIVYPITTLVIMFLKSTRQAFAGEVLPVGEDDDDRRYEDERWER